MNIKRLPQIIETRSSSITHEFAVRLLKLSEQSQNLSQTVETVPGPWENALLALSKTLANKPVLVYLDAPYKREGYSRYYHVLETLVSYAYPSCKGVGLTPSPEERFRSEFSKRDSMQHTKTFVKIITSILKKGWICAWSYANIGEANMYEVINSTHHEVSCDIKSYSVPSVHKSQGGRSPKKVIEYLIIFSPKK